MSLSGWELSSRLLGTVQPLYVVKQSVVPGKYILTLWPLSTDLPAPGLLIDIPAAHPHFPYGYDVFPD